MMNGARADAVVWILLLDKVFNELGTKLCSITAYKWLLVCILFMLVVHLDVSGP